MAGRAVRLSPDIPAAFDAPLAPHHKLIGRWAASRVSAVQRYTRNEVRRRIEREFNAAVLDILGPFNLADLRIAVLRGDEARPPAIAVICNSVGQIDLGWIEKSNVLANTLFMHVAPVSWRAAAYEALVETLSSVLPIFDYQQLLEEISLYYWDGELEDEGARRALGYIHGADPDDLGEMVLPSDMNARRPDWMLAENAAALKHLPEGLRQRLRRLRAAAKAVRAETVGNAWYFNFHEMCEYFDEYEDCAHLPPMTLVCADTFAAELDEVGRHGMEYGFMDVAGLCPLDAPGKVDDWLASFRRGAEVLLAAQDLITLDPAKL